MIISSLLTKKNHLTISLLAVLFLINHQPQATAQQINVIGVSPFDQTPASNDPLNSISGNTIPPLPTITPASDTITIPGAPTPSRSPVPTNSVGVGSSQPLPSPPSLSEPFRRSSSDVSPENQTPVSDNPNAVEITPTNNNPVVTSPTTNNTANIPIQRRRTMSEILVWDSSTPVRTDNNTTVANIPSNNNVNTNGGAFRVFVRASNANEEIRVKEVYPEAFRSNYQGNVVWQVGLFSSRQNAEQAAEPLRSMGLSPLLVPAN